MVIVGLGNIGKELKNVYKEVMKKRVYKLIYAILVAFFVDIIDN